MERAEKKMDRMTNSSWWTIGEGGGLVYVGTTTTQLVTQLLGIDRKQKVSLLVCWSHNLYKLLDAIKHIDPSAGSRIGIQSTWLLDYDDRLVGRKPNEGPL